jgi:hypothetical protein
MSDEGFAQEMQVKITELGFLVKLAHEIRSSIGPDHQFR